MIGAEERLARDGELVLSVVIPAHDESGSIESTLRELCRALEAAAIPHEVVVVDRGRLGTWLLDQYSARKLGLASTGNASRSAGSAPSAAPTKGCCSGRGTLNPSTAAATGSSARQTIGCLPART